MRRRGITMTELLVVLAIIAVLVAVSLPVISGAMADGKVTRSLSQMKQLTTALHLYCQDQGCDERLGVGIPPAFSVVVASRKLPPELLRTGGTALNPQRQMMDIYLTMFPLHSYRLPLTQPQLANFAAHVQRTGGNPVLLVDATHNPAEVAQNAFRPRLLLGAFYDGSVRRQRVSGGNLTAYEPWESTK